MQRNTKAPQLIKLNNAASKDGRIFVAGKHMTDIHMLENEWVHYTVKVVVDPEESGE